MATAIDTYTDAEGMTQHRVTGPRGTFLVTRGRRDSSYQVWRPDSLRTLYRSEYLRSALIYAEHRATAATV